jgi:hypothetical protein
MRTTEEDAKVRTNQDMTTWKSSAPICRRLGDTLGIVAFEVVAHILLH